MVFWYLTVSIIVIFIITIISIIIIIIIASSNYGFCQNKWLHIKCRTWNGIWNGSKCRNQHHDSGYRTTDMTFCRLIAKRLSMRHLIMSVQEVLVTGCACMLVCLFCMGIPGAHIASWYTIWTYDLSMVHVLNGKRCFVSMVIVWWRTWGQKRMTG